MALQQVVEPNVPYSVWAVDTLSDFVEFLETKCTVDDAFFRGQSEDWPLRPKLSRMKRRADWSATDVEQRMLGHFERAAAGHDAPAPTSRWDVLSLAQHHGLPTRLLDWSRSPLVALWFAVEKAPRAGIAHGVVWLICPSADDYLPNSVMALDEVKDIWLWEPRHVTPRITAQVGSFTVHPYDHQGDRFLAVDESRRLQNRIQKILVPAEQMHYIRFHLDRCGVNAASVYPDMDGLARYIEWFHSYMDDEGRY